MSAGYRVRDWEDHGNLDGPPPVKREVEKRDEQGEPPTAMEMNSSTSVHTAGRFGAELTGKNCPGPYLAHVQSSARKAPGFSQKPR